MALYNVTIDQSGNFVVGFTDAAARSVIVDALGKAYSYPATINDPKLGAIPNPESPDNFFARQLSIWIKEVAHTELIKQAVEIARITKTTELETDFPVSPAPVAVVAEPISAQPNGAASPTISTTQKLINKFFRKE